MNTIYLGGLGPEGARNLEIAHIEFVGSLLIYTYICSWSAHFVTYDKSEAIIDQAPGPRHLRQKLFCTRTYMKICYTLPHV